MKREDIIQSLMAQKIVIFQETSSMNVDYFRYLVLAGNFLNFRLCEIQPSTQCLLGEHGPLIYAHPEGKRRGTFHVNFVFCLLRIFRCIIDEND